MAFRRTDSVSAGRTDSVPPTTDDRRPTTDDRRPTTDDGTATRC